jgi:hypothetical protein
MSPDILSKQTPKLFRFFLVWRGSSKTKRNSVPLKLFGGVTVAQASLPVLQKGKLSGLVNAKYSIRPECGFCKAVNVVLGIKGEG